jgi:hypothetical protein
MSAPSCPCDPSWAVTESPWAMILHTLPLALAHPTAPADEGPSVRLSTRPQLLRLRRELPASASGRVWLLEIEVEVPAVDPERLLAHCEDYLVDDSDGRQIGVVDRVERFGTAGAASALLVAAGWFGRRWLRVDAHAIEALVPAERRLIVDGSRVYPIGRDGRPV